MFSDRGRPPFTDSYPYLIEKNTRKGTRPRRHVGPTFVERGLTDDVWNLIECCWQQNWKQRPEIAEVLKRLKVALAVFNDSHRD